MVALAYTDITDITDITTPAPAVTAASKPAVRRPVHTSDPVVDMATRMLSVPLRQLYALAWRAGLLLVD